MSTPGGCHSSGISLRDALRLPKRHPACRRREAQSGSRKKLTCSDRAANSRRCQDPGSTCLCHGHDWFDLYGVAKVSQAFDQVCFLLVGRTAIEVIAAEVLVHRPVLKHVVDGGKDGGDDGHDGLLGAAPRFDAIELGLQVAVFLFYRRPGALHQRGFEPGTALAQAIGSALAGTLVVARTYAGARDEMCSRREPAHVDSNLGDDDVSAEVLDAWNRPYEFDCGAKGPKVRLHLRV